MGISAGPKIITDGLTFLIDPKNDKSYLEVPSERDHGISDWYCFQSGYAQYSSIYSNTEIIEIDSNGVEVGIVTISSAPGIGSFPITAGNRYYGTKAIGLIGIGPKGEGRYQHKIAPISFAGTSFADYNIRYDPITFYVYAPKDETTIEFFDNNAVGGITGTASSTVTIPKTGFVTFSSSAINTWQFFKADNPIIMSAEGNGNTIDVGDNTILAPATQYHYRRNDVHESTVVNSTPSGIGTYVVYDTNNLVTSVEIGDGAGGDKTQGIGLEYLSDTYSWGQTLSDYAIIAPYPNTVVNVYYYSGGSWVLGESHTLSGITTEPAFVFREGTNGFGVDGDILRDSGLAADFASGADTWKFEGTQPFSIVVNDLNDDEERLFGWMKNNYIRKSSNVTQSICNLADGPNGKEPKIHGKSFLTALSSADYITFDGTNDYIDVSSDSEPDFNATSFSVGCWYRTTDSDMRLVQNASTGSFGAKNGFQISVISGSTFGNTGVTNSSGSSFTFSSVSATPYIDGNWHQLYLTFDTTTGTGILNIDKVQVGIETSSGLIGSNLNGVGLEIGRANSGVQILNGDIGHVIIYNRVLNLTEIEENYNALKGRFGL